MTSRKGQTEYAWIFSLIIGALIIFLAVFFSGRYVQTATFQSDIEMARQFDLLLNPFASIGAIATMTLSQEVSMPSTVFVNFTCSSESDYDQMMLKTLKQKTFSEGANYKIYNKYIFSGNLQGKSFWIFSKSLYMPWRVDDMIYIVDGSYCFLNPPEGIKSEISDLGNDKISLQCSTGSRRVCFDNYGQGCDVSVYYSNGLVKKGGKSLLFYGDAMMYGAIFSDSLLYVCNIQRLAKRISVQADINKREAQKLSAEGCETSKIQADLLALKGDADKGDPNLILMMGSIADRISKENPSQCPIF